MSLTVMHWVGSRTTDAKRVSCLHWTAENSIPIPIQIPNTNIYVRPKYILSATLAQFFKQLSFMPSLGVRSPWVGMHCVLLSWCFTKLGLFQATNSSMCDNYVPQRWDEFNDELNWLFSNRFRYLNVVCRKKPNPKFCSSHSLNFHVSGSTESGSRQPTQYMAELNSTLQHIIVTCLKFCS